MPADALAMDQGVRQGKPQAREVTPIAPTWLDCEALDDAPLTADGRRYEGGVRELQEPRSRVRCWIVHGLPAERPVKATDPRHGINERIRASIAGARTAQERVS